jgi:hypothetical protein
VTEALHEKYVPVLHFARGEQFFPMAVEDFVGYCALRARGETSPLVERGRVAPELLARAHRERDDVYLQSVPSSLADQNVASRWGHDVVDLLADLSSRTSNWQVELAKVAYRWLSPKTQEATKLFWWNDLVMSLVGAGRRSGKDLPRLNLPPEIRQAAVENYQASQPRRPNYTYYYRTTRDRHYLCLQYWFFYGYNDWATSHGGMNDHEGDWEGMYYFFELDAAGKPKGTPAYVTYVGHHSRLTKPWGHRDITLDGNHPVGYVAAGSHATYPERKEYDLIKIYDLVDYATGDGTVIEPGDWVHRVDLDRQPWTTDFLGGWGTRYWLPLSWAKQTLGFLRTKADEIGLPGVSAPRGPRYADDGQVRPNWIQAAAWAGVFDLEHP